MVNTESATYRRGLTLGLTMAEIFMLLLFLLLLAILALHKEHKDTLKEKEDELEVITKKYEERAELPKEIERLKRENKELENSIAEVKKENSIAKSLLNKQREKLPEDIQQLTEKVDALENELADANKENADKTEKLKSINKQNTVLRNQLSAEKGVDPPCWYEIVLRNGKRHEKPYYLFDVEVHDEHLNVRVNENMPLPGRAVDESGESASTSYAEEYAKLSLVNFVVGEEKKISLEEFSAIAKLIKDMGKNKEIREYSCVFYAKIWDSTSATAKERWKNVYKRINDFFYTFPVVDDPWINQ